jgi:hypothetical protein
MSKLVVSSLVFFLALFSAQTVCSSNAGGYTGFGLGVSSLGDVEDTTSFQYSGFSGRVFAGYNFNEYFGIEGAFAPLHTQSYVLNDYSWFMFDYKLSALSLVGKLYLPINDRFRLSLSLGGAEMFTNFDATTMFNTSSHYLDSSNTLTGAIGVGAGFDLTEHLKTNLDLILYGQKDGDESHFAVPESTLFTIGLAYQF